MNDYPQAPRDDLEAKLTSLLLGELPEAEAAELRRALAADPQLAQLRVRLAQAIGLVREAAAVAPAQEAGKPEPLRLAAVRREKLLAHFKTVPMPVVAKTAPAVRRQAHELKWLVPMSLAAAAVVVIGLGLSLTTIRSRDAIDSEIMLAEHRGVAPVIVNIAKWAGTHWGLVTSDESKGKPVDTAVDFFAYQTDPSKTPAPTAGDKLEITKLADTQRPELAQIILPGGATLLSPSSSKYDTVGDRPAALPLREPAESAARRGGEVERERLLARNYREEANAVSEKLKSPASVRFTSAGLSGGGGGIGGRGPNADSDGVTILSRETLAQAQQQPRPTRPQVNPTKIPGVTTTNRQEQIQESAKKFFSSTGTPANPSVRFGDDDLSRNSLAFGHGEGTMLGGYITQTLDPESKPLQLGERLAEDKATERTTVGFDWFERDSKRNDLRLTGGATLLSPSSSISSTDRMIRDHDGEKSVAAPGTANQFQGRLGQIAQRAAGRTKEVQLQLTSDSGITANPKPNPSDESGLIATEGTVNFGAIALPNSGGTTLFANVPGQNNQSTVAEEQLVRRKGAELPSDARVTTLSGRATTAAAPTSDDFSVLTKSGVGALGLNGASTFSGGTTVTAGTTFTGQSEAGRKLDDLSDLNGVARGTMAVTNAVANSYAGGIVINGGALIANNPTPPYARQATLDGIDLGVSGVIGGAGAMVSIERGRVNGGDGAVAYNFTAGKDGSDAKGAKELPALQAAPDAPTAGLALKRQTEVRGLDEMRELEVAEPKLAPAKKESAGISVLGDLPLLGRFFRSESRAKDVTATPAPAAPPASAATQPASPTAGKPAVLQLKPGIADREGRGEAAKQFSGELAAIEDRAKAKADVVEGQKLNEQIQQLAGLPPESPAQPTAPIDAPRPKPQGPAPVPQPEFAARDNAFSTFSLNVSDVSFKLAAASLEQGHLPDPSTVRSEEFLNAFDYRDPEALPGVPVAFAWERARDPFAHNRDLLRFSVKTAATGRQAGRPLNLVLLLDNSGSMERADRVRIVREALRVLAAQLSPADRVSVITFARTARLWVDGAGGEKAGEVFEKVGGLTPEGGTNLEEAMKLAYATAARHYLTNGLNRMVLMTDGAANLGEVEPAALQARVEAQRKQGIATDCFGIGWEGFNDDLLEVLARHGDGRYGFLNSPEEAAEDFVGQLAGALKIAASDVKVQVEFNPRRVNVWRQIGYAKHQLTKEQFRDNTVDAAELAAQEAGNALYAIEVNPAGLGPIATVRVRFKIPGTSDYREHAWDVPFAGNAAALEQSSAAMRLAVVAGEFGESLAASPFAAEVTPTRLLNYLTGVPEVFGADSRPKKLEWMIRQAKSVSGK